jgi:cytochrome b561
MCRVVVLITSLQDCWSQTGHNCFQHQLTNCKTGHGKPMVSRAALRSCVMLCQRTDGWVVGRTPLSHWSAPIIGVVIYLTVIFTLRIIVGAPQSTKNEAPWLKAAVLVHNAILCIWSFIMFIGIVIDVIAYAQTFESLNGLVCLIPMKGTAQQAPDR